MLGRIIILYELRKSIKKFNQSLKMLSLNLPSQYINSIQKHNELREKTISLKRKKTTVKILNKSTTIKTYLLKFYY